MKTKLRKVIILALAVCLVVVVSAMTVSAAGHADHATTSKWISNKDISVTVNSNGVYAVGSAETFKCSVEGCGATNTVEINLSKAFNDAVNKAEELLDDTATYDPKGTTYGALNNAYKALTKLAEENKTYSSEEIKTKITGLESAITVFNADESRYMNYTVKFVVDGKTVQEKKNCHYGDKITAPTGTPTKEDDTVRDFKYVYKGWDKSVAATVTESVTYTAVFHKLTHDECTIDPTCTKAGKATYYCVEKGGCTYTEVFPVDALGHDWGKETVVNKEYCDQEGYVTKVCKRCNDTERTVFAPKTSHVMESVAAVKPTCTENGAKAGKKCRNCKYTEGLETVAALGHTEAVDAAVAATCTEKGKTEGKHCSVCGEVLKKQGEIAALGHDIKKDVKQATCTEKGGVYYSCAREGCDYAKVENEVDALGHKWDDGVVTIPTCTEPGFTLYTCKTCKETKQEEPKDALGHAEIPLVIKPTCNEGGYTLYTCKICGNERKGDETPALEHKYKSETIQPTCTEKGCELFTCEYCGDEMRLNEKPALGHTYSKDYEKVLDPTCTQDGYNARYCDVCAAEDKQVLTAFGHDYSGWTKTLDPTCTQDGIEESVCKTCGDVQEKAIPALGHSYGEWEVIEDSTCGKKGIQAMTCKVCGDQEVDEIPLSGEHTYKVITEPATTEKDGKVYTVCAVCNTVGESQKIYKITTVKLSFTSVKYNGETRKPSVTVKDWKGVSLINGTDYTVKYADGRKNPGVYNVTVTFKGDYKGTKKLSFKIIPENVKKVTAEYNSTAIKLKWAKVIGATGYRVFRYDYATKSYKKIADVNGTSYKDTGLKPGSKYTYRVQSFAKSGSSVCWSAERSPSVVLTTKPSAPKATVKAGTSKAVVSYDSVNGAYGYQIYMSTSKNGDYTKVKTTDDIVFTKTGLSKGKTYYFKVRAYTKVGDVKTYSNMSEPVAVKVK